MPPNQSRPVPAASRVYLIIYNTTCAFLWLRILVLVVGTLISAPEEDISVAYTTLEPWTRCAQTLAVAEILHAATGKSSR
jgi:very-long-chain (3R)-3-hydroxyacyl-CoA dehydratase